MHVKWIACFFISFHVMYVHVWVALYMLSGLLFFVISLLVGQCMCICWTWFQSHQLGMFLCGTLAMCYITYILLNSVK